MMPAGEPAPTPTPSAAHAPSRPRPDNRWAALSGVLSGATTLGVASLVAVLFGPSSNPVVAVGGAFVDATPAWLKDFAVSTFAANDKVALFVGMAIVVLVLTAGIGLVATRSLRVALGLVVALGAVALAAVLTREGVGTADAIPTLVGTVAGMLTLQALVVRLPAPRSAAPAQDGGDRRAFLRYAVLAGSVAAIAAVGGQLLGASRRVAETARQVLRLPVPVRPAPALPAGVQSATAGVTPFVTPTDEFYRIDTALLIPQVDPATWTLRVYGMVEDEVEITFDELLAEDLVEAWVTLACVSNPVGGDLVGNAKWLGLPIRELLARAKPLPGADMVLSRSVDGFTASTPLEVLTDDRDALLAVAMNDEPLPLSHGFPVRMVVPGLYGYVSATKWVTELKVTTFADDVAYWTPRGWSERGPIKTASRIDVPRADANLTAGTVAVGGVAWAQHVGVVAVEVQVDHGEWEAAALADEASTDTWRQWSYLWEASSGPHTLRVRATDATGKIQTSTEAPPAPDGASGWHEVTVDVG
ncbi:DMSO/TMAO reductase YedYZ, molybdopterin-dependent catalytic subunit [Sanguibacter gelidistatuariae]|uniref:DMSO/TMAO reductase YedYZ, molybdopterin-dependent catalytic subunit n=1 Tax=Sanguibacter gelidistatuariae TaxID=1814289 RepID=A0A1G6MS54_9MICO|nr:molybdopterin-dependent oxidoreductase [Sanguibacter gelidistatuariae]SDC58047.1 DMSO/TMAO reductase YedYZ, molybdopterin-dependent catalytic subunit [Sanguibacter gelidistatuariae]